MIFSQEDKESPYDPTYMKGIAETTKIDDIDNINLFNGNINISIPSGPSYQVGPLLNSRINLIYNSKIWKNIRFQYQLSPDAQCPPGPHLF